MPELIANLFQRKTARQQVPSTSMAQTMRAAPRETYAEGGEARVYDRGDAGWQEWANRRVKAEKQLAVCAPWPGLLQVT